MAPRAGHRMDRETVTARRARIVLLAGRGWAHGDIAREVNPTRRQVERHIAAARDGRPVGKQRKRKVSTR